MAKTSKDITTNMLAEQAAQAEALQRIKEGPSLHVQKPIRNMDEFSEEFLRHYGLGWKAGHTDDFYIVCSSSNAEHQHWFDRGKEDGKLAITLLEDEKRFAKEQRAEEREAKKQRKLALVAQ